MNRRLTLLLCLLLLPLTMSAQRGLNIAGVLDGRYKKNPNTTDIVIKGSQLAEFHLSYYHSLTVENDATIMDAVVKAFVADEAEAQDKEVAHTGQRLYYGFYRLKFNGETNRFVFFKDHRFAPGEKRPCVTLIYMEGSASLSFLKMKFKK